MKEIGYCGNHCEYFFLLNVTAVRAIIQAVLMLIYLMIRSALMLFAVKTKVLTAVGNVIKQTLATSDFSVRVKMMRKRMLYT